MNCLSIRNFPETCISLFKPHDLYVFLLPFPLSWRCRKRKDGMFYEITDSIGFGWWWRCVIIPRPCLAASFPRMISLFSSISRTRISKHSISIIRRMVSILMWHWRRSPTSVLSASTWQTESRIIASSISTIPYWQTRNASSITELADIDVQDATRHLWSPIPLPLLAQESLWRLYIISWRIWESQTWHSGMWPNDTTYPRQQLHMYLTHLSPYQEDLCLSICW